MITLSKLNRRQNKALQIRKMKGWQLGEKDWKDLAAQHLDKVWEISGKQDYYNVVSERDLAIKIYYARIQMFQEIAEILNIRLNRGEATWAVQNEVTYHKNLYQRPINDDNLRDNLIYSLKYVLEIIYNRHGYPDYDTLKKEFYQKDIPEIQDYLEAEEFYFKELCMLKDDIKKRIEDAN